MRKIKFENPVIGISTRQNKNEGRGVMDTSWETQESLSRPRYRDRTFKDREREENI